jgi:hypothetical protein
MSVHPDKTVADDEERSGFDRLFSLLYDDLRQIARRHLRNERAEHTLAAQARPGAATQGHAR